MASRIIIHIMLYNILYVDIDIYIQTKAFSENCFRKFNCQSSKDVLNDVVD